MAAEIPDGAFLVARAIFNSSLWTMPDSDRILAITAIGIANWRPRKLWHNGAEVVVGRGQFIRSLKQLCEASHLKHKVVRTSLNKLIRAQFLARKRAGLSYLYTVCKYEQYQDLTKYADSEWPEMGTVSGIDLGTKRAHLGHTLGTKQEEDKGEQQQQDKKDVTPRPSGTRPSHSEGEVSLPAVAAASGGKGTEIEGEFASLTAPDPEMGKQALEGIGVAPETAHALACRTPIGTVLDVCCFAAKQKRPAGFAIAALKDEYKTIPKAPREVLAAAADSIQKARLERADRLLRGKRRGCSIKQLPGESTDDYLRRVVEEARKTGGGSS